MSIKEVVYTKYYGFIYPHVVPHKRRYFEQCLTVFSIQWK